MFKKGFLVLFVALLAVFVLDGQVNAELSTKVASKHIDEPVNVDDSLLDDLNSGVEGADGKDKILQLIDNVRGMILGFGAALAVLVILVGSIMYITSTGNEDKVALAKKLITYAVVGLVLIILAEVLLTIYTRALGSDYSVPESP